MADSGRHMLNSADDLRDRAFVTYRAFCLALCFGHVSPGEPAARSKSPGFKAAQPNQGAKIGPVPGSKEHLKHPAQRAPPASRPLSLSLSQLFYLVVSLWLVQVCSDFTCLNLQVGHRARSPAHSVLSVLLSVTKFPPGSICSSSPLSFLCLSRL